MRLVWIYLHIGNNFWCVWGRWFKCPIDWGRECYQINWMVARSNFCTLLYSCDLVGILIHATVSRVVRSLSSVSFPPSLTVSISSSCLNILPYEISCISISYCSKWVIFPICCFLRCFCRSSGFGLFYHHITFSGGTLLMLYPIILYLRLMYSLIPHVV